MIDIEDELELDEPEDTIQITITTPNHQIRTFKGTPEALALNDWNKIMEGIINSEVEYEAN